MAALALLSGPERERSSNSNSRIGKPRSDPGKAHPKPHSLGLGLVARGEARGLWADAFRRALRLARRPAKARWSGRWCEGSDRLRRRMIGGADCSRGSASWTKSPQRQHHPQNGWPLPAGNSPSRPAAARARQSCSPGRGTGQMLRKDARGPGPAGSACNEPTRAANNQAKKTSTKPVKVPGIAF